MSAENNGLQRITILTDNTELVEMLTDVFSHGYAVRGVAGLEEIAASRPDLLMVDLWHVDHGTAGSAGLDALRTDGLSDIPLIVYSTEAQDSEHVSDSSRMVFLQAPFGLDALEQAVGELLDGAGGAD